MKNKTISIETAEKYNWGRNCSGWHLVKNNRLGVIQELMPPGTSEVMHRHLQAQQFFFILKGEATFIFENEKKRITSNQGVHIPAGEKHQIKNESSSDLEFLVISEPHAHGDREVY